LGKHLSKEKLIELLAVNSRKILGLDYQIKTRKQADFILIDFDKDWTFADTDIRSKSKNTPFIGSELKGIVKAVFSNDKVFLNGK
jgi:dihydroorotase